MADFSHLPALIYRPELVAKLAARSEAVTDEVLLEIFRRIEPALLDPRHGDVVEAILEKRRGRRPRSGVPSMNWLARRIAGLNRPDIHPAFLKALATRIATGTGYRQDDLSRPLLRTIRYRQRDSMIRGLYWQFRSMLKDSPRIVTHPQLGDLDIPQDMTPRYQAARMTQAIIVEYFDPDPPSEERILRIAAMRQ